MIDVIILDDHTMVLKGIETMLADTPNISVSHTFNKGEELLDHLKLVKPDVLLLDINLPKSNGIELCGFISKTYPDISIIGLSNYSDTSFIKNMMRNGANGYLLKNTCKDELIEAIKTIHSGNTYLPKILKDKLLNESIGVQSSSFIPQLTRREQEILECVANELTNNEISEQLFISTKTVESHRKNLLQKFGVRNTAGLIKEAFVKGLLK
ncbi:response regulator transcription factor [Winogradskyella sp.]|uniref:response regulator n=1 Tax=Winogradskyella sp. TaxID=1883156 RepID=UPI00261277B9|nr:response regulator transcription factor [Winogradskyella sp.]